MRTPTSRERGLAMALAALWLAAIVAIAAITIEVSRLTDTATEVQVAVDAAALAAAENMLKGGNVDSAKAAARTVASQNRTDGRPPECGGGRAPLVSAGETIQLKNGNMTPILKEF